MLSLVVANCHHYEHGKYLCDVVLFPTYTHPACLCVKDENDSHLPDSLDKASLHQEWNQLQGICTDLLREYARDYMREKSVYIPCMSY